MKIGDKVICVKLDHIVNGCGYRGGEPDNQRLILGETYKITDIDFHFPGKVCVKLKGPYYFNEEFVPEECFSKIAAVRDEKLKKLGIK